MQLFLNNTSPYARFVRIVLLEKGLETQVELCWCDPWSDDASLLAHNPVGRIPALVTDTGTCLSESLLIALYLNELQAAYPLLPPQQREKILSLAGLGQGLMDAAFHQVMARKYLDDGNDASLLSQRRIRAIARTLAQLEQDIAGEQITLGAISVAVAIDYLAFRLPEFGIADAHPHLVTWHRQILQRESFRSTALI